MNYEDNKGCIVIKHSGKELVVMYSKRETLDGTLHTMYISNTEPPLYLVKRMSSDYVLDFEEKERMIERLLRVFKQAFKRKEVMLLCDKKTIKGYTDEL